MELRFNHAPIVYHSTGEVQIGETLLTREEFEDIDARIHTMRKRGGLESSPQPSMSLVKRAPWWIRFLSRGKILQLPTYQPSKLLKGM